MKIKIFIRILLIVSLSLCFMSIALADTGEEVIVSISPFHAPEKIWHLYSPFIDYLNKNSNIKWRLKIYPNHDFIKKALCDGEIAIALFGPIPAYSTYKECGAELLIFVANEDGRPEFRVFILTANPKIKSIKDLKGKRIGLFKPSTAAYVMTKKMLDDEGVNEENANFLIYQNLERIINDVITGGLDAGGIREYSNISFKNLNLKVLKASDPVPGFVFMSSPKTPVSLKKEFSDILLRLSSLEKNKFKEITKDWDETIKHGFLLPKKDYIKGAERFNILYEKYKK